MAMVQYNILSLNCHLIIPPVLAFVRDFETLCSLALLNQDILTLFIDFYPLATKDGPSVAFEGPRADISVLGNPMIPFLINHARVIRLATDDYKYVCTASN